MTRKHDGGRPGSIRDALISKIGGLYGEVPEYLFRTSPDTVVFRHSGNRKWFVIFMTVEGVKIGLDSAEPVDILNLKLDPFLIEHLRTQPGYRPAYHMNHDKWLTVRLDGTVPVEDIEPLIEMSFDLTGSVRGGKGAVRRGHAARGSGLFAGESGETEMRAGGQNWIIPANPANYDVAAGFEREGTLVWHIRPYVCPGDIIFIYETMPRGCIQFKCEVIEADLPYHSERFPTCTRAMRIKLLREYPLGFIDRAFMRKHGVTNVRSARSAPAKLVRAIAALEKE